MTKEEKRKRKLEYNRNYYLKNRDTFLEEKRKYREVNREILRKKQESYRNQNREKVNLGKMESYYKYRDEILKRRRSLYKLNRDGILYKRRQYTVLHKEIIRRKERERYQTCIELRIAKVLRSRISDALRNGTKSARTEELLGTTIQEFKVYLERRFKPNMTWKNYGDWEIDHIHPVSKFNLVDLEGQKKAFHYSNMQPLWFEENRRKGAKILN